MTRDWLLASIYVHNHASLVHVPARKHLCELFRCDEWRLDVQGSFQRELESRGVLDPRTLPNYAYRDDGLMVHKAVDAYVKKICRHYYGAYNHVHDSGLL